MFIALALVPDVAEIASPVRDPKGTILQGPLFHESFALHDSHSVPMARR